MPKIIRKDVNILKVGITGTKKHLLLAKIKNRIRYFDTSQPQGEPIFITTPNPEQILLAQKDDKFKQVLNYSDISLPDGVGLAFAGKFINLRAKRQKREKNRLELFCSLFQGLYVGIYGLLNKKWLFEEFQIVKGREFFLDLIKLADENSWKVFLLGGKNNVVEKTGAVLKKTYRNIRFAVFEGPILDDNGMPKDEENVPVYNKSLELINNFKPHLLFVAFGAPKQENWVYKNIAKMRTGLVMVVGGTYDYIAGTENPTPRILDGTFFEWLWRLIKNPKNRLKRIINAVIVFPFKVFLYNLNGKQ